MIPKRPLLVQELFMEERTHLLQLLGSLSPSDFRLPSPCPGWKLQDLVAHLIGDDLGGLAGGRDRMSEYSFTGEWSELVSAINRQNEAWVEALRRLSPRVLIELLEYSRDRWIDYILSCDLMGRGPNVAWAGTGSMPMWLHVAREYTERWTHQMQIRETVGAPGLTDARMFHPVLDAFAYALPVAFQHTPATQGAHVLISITGEAGGDWSLIREENGWSLFEDVDVAPAASVQLDQDVAWRLWTGGMGHEEARSKAVLKGDLPLFKPVLHAVAMIV